MKAYVQLTLAQLRLFARNRQVLFWTMFFPVFFMVMLGSFLGNGSGVSVSGYIVDEDGTDAAKRVADELTGSGALALKTGLSREEALAALKRGDARLKSGHRESRMRQ